LGSVGGRRRVRTASRENGTIGARPGSTRERSDGLAATGLRCVSSRCWVTSRGQLVRHRGGGAQGSAHVGGVWTAAAWLLSFGLGLVVWIRVARDDRRLQADPVALETKRHRAAVPRPVPRRATSVTSAHDDRRCGTANARLRRGRAAALRRGDQGEGRLPRGPAARRAPGARAELLVRLFAGSGLAVPPDGPRARTRERLAIDTVAVGIARVGGALGVGVESRGRLTRNVDSINQDMVFWEEPKLSMPMSQDKPFVIPKQQRSITTLMYVWPGNRRVLWAASALARALKACSRAPTSRRGLRGRARRGTRADPQPASRSALRPAARSRCSGRRSGAAA